MAKRKRLTPATPDNSFDTLPPLEVKSAAAPGRVFQPRAPIADVAHDASASAALSEVTQTLTDARTQGRLIQQLPLDMIDADYLVRDRLVVDADEMTALVDSIVARGQQAAIEVTALENGRYGLISGWRRLAALRQIQRNDAGVTTVLAIVRTPQDAADAYLAMVEENEVRVGLSYYERARIVARAVDRGVYAKDRLGLAALFHTASRPKRSKIGSFLRIVRALDNHLRFPTALTERTGLAIAHALEADPDVQKRIVAALEKADCTSAEAELAVITKALSSDRDASQSAITPQAETLPNGVEIVTGKAGQITLKGAQLRDPACMERLRRFLATV